MIVEDAFSYSYGITGTITKEQEDILMSAANNWAISDGRWNSCVVMKAMKIIRWGDLECELSFDKDQMIKLGADNWPRHPVLATTFMIWS